MTTQDPFVDRLSDYLDAEDMTAEERTSIAAHLAACTSCRTTLAELQAVASRAASLPDLPPERDLWDGISRRLPTTARVLPLRARRFSFTLPQLVAAGLALVVLSGALTWFARQSDTRATLPPVAADTTPAPAADVFERASFAEPQFDAAIADLEKALAEHRNRLDAETIRILEENLLSIDLAIEQARKALRADPANVYLNNHFAASRNRKLALLRRASALALAHDTSGS